MTALSRYCRVGPRRSAAWVLLASSGLAWTLGGCSDGGSDADPLQPPPSTGSIRLVEVARGFEAPVYLAAPTGDSRLFVVEQTGRIRIVRDGSVLPTPFLDLSSRVSTGGERGLLGLAFPPDYDVQGRFFVHYTDPAGDTRVASFERSADPDRADPASERSYLAVPQPFQNHNGGQIAFGPDGHLYVALGDGGSGGDPLGAAQDRTRLLGSILRLDVSADPPYRIPSDNPFVGAGGGIREEIWAWGLRNPWRFSFDVEGGTLYIGDVGQNRLEEIDARPAQEGGVNYGWNVREGNRCFVSANCDPSGLVDPVLTYDHANGCSVTGGYVYRGTAIPELVGRYVYGDFCGGWVRSFQLANGQAVGDTPLDVGTVANLSSFGVDASGELYALSLSGVVYRFAPGT